MSQPRTFSSLLDQHTGLLYKVFMEAMQAVRREFGSLKKISEISDVSVATLRRIYSNSFTFDRPPAMLTYEAVSICRMANIIFLFQTKNFYR